MEAEVLISVDGLSKKFSRSLRRSLWYGLKDIGRELVGGHQRSEQLRPEEFWALQDISFTVRSGEMLGLVGANGAGKSTLLKLLHGLLKPDAGQITMRGRVQALIELGAGFNPILSGRENVYINAAVLGIPKVQVDRLLPSIVEFAGLEEFIDTPVQNYSSGMKARLGFSVIIQLDPDVLLIDEVLAVGDMAFQEKCLRRMDALRKSNKAIVFVTHSLYQVEALCNRALWLDRGKVVLYGEASQVVRSYLDHQERLAMAESQQEGIEYQGRATEAARAYLSLRDRQKPTAQDAPAGAESDLIRIRKVELVDNAGHASNEFDFLSDITVRIHYSAVRRIPRPLFNLRIFHKGQGLLEASMLIDGHGPEWIEGEGVVECWLPQIPLTPKQYEIVLFVRSGDGIADVFAMRTVAQFRITDHALGRVPLRGPMALNHLRQGSPIYTPRVWRFYNGQTSEAYSVIEAGYEASV